MTEQLDGKAVLAAVHYVRDFYSNIARLLQAADLPLADLGWAPHDGSWKSIPAAKRSLRQPERWMPHYVIRQYKREDGDPKELLTVAAIPHDPIDKEIEEPLLLCSRIRFKKTSDLIYWVPLVQLRRKEGLGRHSEVLSFGADDLKPKRARLEAFEAHVDGDEILSIIVPLVQITDERTLVETAITPLLGAEYTRAVTPDTSTVEPSSEAK